MATGVVARAPGRSPTRVRRLRLKQWTTSSPQQTAPVDTSRDSALDGLRGFAALAVSSSHLAVYFGLLPFPPLGAIGVLVFFVLSGYLIATICWRSAPTARSYALFLRRRVVRLTPVVLALVLVGGPALVLWGGLDPGEVVRDGAATLFQVTALTALVVDDQVAAFNPTWSLTVEWVFYLVFPVVLIGLRRRGDTPREAARVLAGAAAVLYAVGLFLPVKAFYLLPVANLGVLFAGAALATWHLARERDEPSDTGRTAMAMGMLAVFVVLPGYTLGWGWKAVILPAVTLATLVVVHGCRTGSLPTRGLAVRPFVVVGVRAYSLYLWHLPVMWIVWVQLPGLGGWEKAGVSVLVLAAVVTASFELLERPVLRGRVRDRVPLAMADDRAAAVGSGPVLP
ncbi:acyltransferase [Phycicoccus sp. CSK15P-2]|uniref:acyltransferase family protein n=1 Tax=Phycicoccus sp. CSK15P-2 TaxID=2807627 RepID=UPI00194F2BD4|nr:acyltransferase [Phycicoccus sp. CSK15P-2]MBM6405969.1 acyltransferase [Phycicoccus sp. CSK15P-2]